jgi:hypothetical protein
MMFANEAGLIDEEVRSWKKEFRRHFAFALPAPGSRKESGGIEYDRQTGGVLVNGCFRMEEEIVKMPRIMKRSELVSFFRGVRWQTRKSAAVSVGEKMAQYWRYMPCHVRKSIL